MSSNPGEPSEKDEYEHYNYEQDKMTGHGGKGRTKKESAQHHTKDPNYKATSTIAKGEEKRRKENIEKNKTSS